MSGMEKIWHGAIHPLDLSQCNNKIAVPEILPGLARGEVCILSAPGGTGKSFFLLEAALGFASGKKTVFPADVRPMKTLYLGCQDDLTRLHNRMVDILNAFPEARTAIGSNLDICFYKGRRPALVVGETIQERVVEDLKKLCTGREVVILDPLSKMHACKENDNYQMDLLTDVLCMVAEETQCTLILAHHSGKSEVTDTDGKKKKGLNSRGASSIIDGVRLGLYLVQEDKKPREVETVSLRWQKINNGAKPDDIIYKRYGGVLIPPWWPTGRQNSQMKEAFGGYDDVPF